MKITDIYAKYTIMPSLQLHMFRVAGVAQIICQSIQKEVDAENIIAACLLHDMGNILKFNLDLFPEFLQPEGKEYWQQIKNDYEKKYGKDEHGATLSIVKELKVSDRIYELVDCFQFSAAEKNENTQDLGIKICSYADMRVEPKSIVSLQMRLTDGRKRFERNNPELFTEDLFGKMSESLFEIEKDIFKKISLKPKDITNETVTPLLENLRNFEL